MSRTSPISAIALALVAASGCSAGAANFTPAEVIDLGALVTDTLPQQLWGTGFIKAMNFKKQNSAEVIKWTFPTSDGKSVSGSNTYFTLFNHGGPHVDAPSHVTAGRGIDGYRVEAFSGPLKVFDVSASKPGRTVPASLFQGHVNPGDVVLIYTRYRRPPGDSLPTVITLSNEAADYLATLPVRAYGTDAFSVEDLSDTKLPLIHQAILSRGIPAYEQLQNLDKLLGKPRAFFVGVPLNMKDGDGMMVRPVAFVY